MTMAQDNADSQANPVLKRLDALAGEWKVEAAFASNPPGVVDGGTTFEWLEGGFFLMQRSHAEGSGIPRAHIIMGGDDTTGAYSMLYSDSRGVFRLYQMTLSDGVWKLWRDAPGFSQRFEGKFSEDGRIITAYSEKSSDGVNWEHDFDLTYTKV
jgi:hypothetical protein